MHGLMMNTPLLISSIAEHGARNHGGREIVSITADNPRHRYTYRECFARAKQLASALDRLGLTHGDRIATICWNDHRHLEAYYGISGALFPLYETAPPGAVYCGKDSTVRRFQNVSTDRQSPAIIEISVKLRSANSTKPEGSLCMD